MELFERLGFKTEEDFNRFKETFGNNWGVMLLMMDPAYYGKLISREFNIERPTFNGFDNYKQNIKE